MRHYELVLLVHPDQSEQLNAMLKRYQDMITKTGGKIHRVEDIGRIQLAYTIEDMHKAHYVLMNIECDDSTIQEVETSFKFNDSIMRHLCLRMTKAETDVSKLYINNNKEAKKEKYAAKEKIKATEIAEKRDKTDVKVKEVSDETDEKKVSDETDEKKDEVTDEKN